MEPGDSLNILVGSTSMNIVCTLGYREAVSVLYCSCPYLGCHNVTPGQGGGIERQRVLGVI